MSQIYDVCGATLDLEKSIPPCGQEAVRRWKNIQPAKSAIKQGGPGNGLVDSDSNSNSTSKVGFAGVCPTVVCCVLRITLPTPANTDRLLSSPGLPVGEVAAARPSSVALPSRSRNTWHGGCRVARGKLAFSCSPGCHVSPRNLGMAILPCRRSRLTACDPSNPGPLSRFVPSRSDWA